MSRGQTAATVSAALIITLAGVMILAAAGEDRVCKGEMIKRDGYVMCRESR